MRVLVDKRDFFRGTHKGGNIEIERDDDGRFYIQVRWKDGGLLYDGWAPEEVVTMEAAKREAIRGAMLEA